MSPPSFLSYCPHKLYGDGCTDTTCPLIHDVKFCWSCAVICDPAANYTAHASGQSHLARVAKPTQLYCAVCEVLVSNPTAWKSHVSARPHTRKATKKGLNPKAVEPTILQGDLKGFKHCGLCNDTFPKAGWKLHLKSRRHRAREQYSMFKAAFERSAQVDDDVKVSHGDGKVDFGVVSITGAMEGVQKTVSVWTEGRTAFTILSASIHSIRRTKFPKEIPPFAMNTLAGEVKVLPGRKVDFSVRFKRDRRGRYEEQLAIICKDAKGSTFVITRRLQATVGDAADHAALKPVTPYVRARRAPWRRDLPVISGERPPPLIAAKYIKKLPRAPIPAQLLELLRSGTPEEIELRVGEKYFTESLTLASHRVIFANLLWIEESRMVEDLQRYDMVEVQFTKDGRLFTLEVLGLAEKRPSVMIGDTVKAQVANGADDGRTHEGFVHDVRLETIRVSFHGSFKSVGKRYNVSFQLNRIPLRRQHQALIASPPAPQRLLFPLPGHSKTERLSGNSEQVTPFNPLIASNAAQIMAVRCVLKLSRGVAPFIIFGPPGTGKTVTIVEAILQILRRDPDAKILACAPSNSAADIIALRLIPALSPEELFRCNAPSREHISVPEELAPYTLYTSNHYAFHPLESLQRYRVIVSTCGNSSFAHNIGMERGHFSHIFVDEAGQATEPDVLTAIKTMALEETRIVLSGDPKQLGPIVRSSIAREHGLDVSYMERLMARDVYDAQTGRGISFVKLLQNYRSHKAILEYPNEKFYDGELEVRGDHHVINSFLGSPQLPSLKFPVVFHAISGHNDRESTSPSFFNIEEACEVKAYVQSLLEDRKFPIRAKDIGVITPYHAQVRKIRKLLRDAGISEVDVGSVEAYQGQERRVIIISTVRSSANLLAYDAKFTLGFVANPRRFNVAVTRAQSLLVVIGDAAILSLDPIWRGFMNYAYSHGGWRGDTPTWDVDAPVHEDDDYMDEVEEALTAGMATLMTQISQDEDLEGDANFDRPFQETD